MPRTHDVEVVRGDLGWSIRVQKALEMAGWDRPLCLHSVGLNCSTSDSNLVTPEGAATLAGGSTAEGPRTRGSPHSSKELSLSAMRRRRRSSQHTGTAQVLARPWRCEATMFAERFTVCSVHVVCSNTLQLPDRHLVYSFRRSVFAGVATQFCLHAQHHWASSRDNVRNHAQHKLSVNSVVRRRSQFECVH